LHIRDIEQVRHVIASTLHELGIPEANWACVKSLEQGRGSAEASRDGVLAVWRTDKNVIEFYGENDRLLRTVSLGPPADREKAA
jgi:hypothetical protein